MPLDQDTINAQLELLAVHRRTLAVYLRRRRTPAVRIGSTAAAADVRRPSWRIRARPLVPALRLMAVALLVLALARPQRGEAVARTQGNGIDIVLALDISSSMSLPFARGETRLFPRAPEPHRREEDAMEGQSVRQMLP